ncbi:MAG: ABC transporter substrate-binding protein [Desulfobacterales bacterium]|nr:ABC transporter substrate-binding protein [Desulfobacterales bacterium]
MKKALLLCSISLCLFIGIDTVVAESQPKMGGTLIFGRAADSVTLDPAKINDSDSSKVTCLVFEGLVRYKDDSTEIEPALAKSWEVSEDGKSWIFHLREGVMFHDNTPFDAHAVVFSFLRQIDPTHLFYRKDFSCAESTFINVKTVEALDPLTVKITLEKLYSPFLSNLAMTVSVHIISPTALKKWGDNFDKHPVGTGPFQFVEWIPQDRIIIEKNPNYWGKKPYLDKIVFKPITNNKSRLLALKTSAINVMDGIDPEMVNEIKKDKNLQLETRLGINVAWIEMNNEKKPFDQVKVRQAVNYAINKPKLIKFVYQDLAIPAKNPIPPMMWGYNDSIVDYEYNPEKAKQLLKEAGYENGFETTLLPIPVARIYMPQPQKIAEIVKNNLAAVGIKVKLVYYDWENYLAKLSAGEHEIALDGWVGDSGDPDSFLYALLDQDNAVKPDALNSSFFRNAELHDILIKAQQVPDQHERAKLYGKAQEIIHREAPWVPLAHVKQLVAFQTKVHGLILHDLAGYRFEKTWIE